MEKIPALELKNISKKFGSKYANKGIDLKVYKGEILSILGENGSGKTTMLNMVSGIYIIIFNNWLKIFNDFIFFFLVFDYTY